MQEENKNISLPYFGIPKILPFAKKYKYRIIAMILMGLFSSLVDSCYPLFNQYALNRYVGENTLDTLGLFIALYIGILIVQVSLNFISVFWVSKTELDLNRDLRNTSFNHLQELSFAYFNQNNVGYIHARVMSDSGKIGELMSWRMMDVVWNGSYILFVMINMVRISWRLACMVFVLVPFAVFIIAFFQKRLVKLNRHIRELNSQITSDFNEGITGARSIKTMVIESIIGDGFQKDTETMRHVSVQAARYQAFFYSTVTMMSSIALAIVMWQGGNLTVNNMMLIGTLSVFMSYALGIMDPLHSVITTISSLVSIQVNIERFDRLVNTESDVADSPEVIEKYGDTFNPKKENWEPLIGDVAFKNVDFKYPDGDEMVLENFNLDVPHGTNVAIVGETGAGKSTLVNLVCRFFEPTKGQVLIDGRDARERSQLWLHSNIGYVLQTPHLFSGTVRDNLRYGKPDATDEEIMRALDLVSAKFVIEKMEKGLDSDVGEGGGMLSTGEKQLLSFARAILADPRILVLDEATASIDTLTEKAIQDAIDTVIKGRTSFVIAHRLSTIVNADVILVVRDGKIIERGTHSELMKHKGYYYELYTRQYEEMVVDTVS
ncbi:MAG: ABC transporter ATP-binding protein [Solobacterium sp.]|nr:ABC transporter ATP-binding protein [Solobacterium sp.]